MSTQWTDPVHAQRPLTPVLGTTPRVLIVRPRKIGDMVLMTPLLRTVRRAYPGATLVVLAQPPCDQVLANNPHVDAVWRYPSDGDLGGYLALARRVRRMRFDAIVDAFGTPATARLTRIAQAPRRIGPRLRGRAWAYTDPVVLPADGTYVGATLGRLLWPLGLRLDRLGTEMFPGQEDRDYARQVLQNFPIAKDQPLVAIGPAVGQAHRRWSADGFARLADALIDRWGARILFVRGPGEAPTVNAVRAAMRSAALPDYPETRTLTQLAALLARCSLFIGHDTGTRHVAIAMGVPTVGIFGKSRPATWTPPQDPRHRTVSFDPGCKGRCIYPNCASMACINEITPQAVLAEVEVLLSRPLVHGQHVDTLDIRVSPSMAASAD